MARIVASLTWYMIVNVKPPTQIETERAKTLSLLKIENGTIVDPANHANRHVGDLWVREGKLIDSSELNGEKPQRTIEAKGWVVMPGGVDMHSHFVGPKVNSARQMLARTTLTTDDRFSLQQSPGKHPAFVPDIFKTGLRYAGLGYTTAMDAAVPERYASQAAMELRHLPCVDAGYFVLVGNQQEVLRAVANGDQSQVQNRLKTSIEASQAVAAKIVNPGGVEDFKSGFRDGVDSIDQELHAFKTTPRDIIRRLAEANDALGMPHAVHVHCNRLGLPGNWQTTLDTMKSVGDARIHLAHVQFHSYRGADDEASFGSAVGPLVDYLNSHPNVTVDIGQVMFGDTISMTGDSALGYYLQKISGKPWVSHDTEQECGCGISPIKYRRKDRIHGLQWAIGLEWMLLANNPWQVALSTDHPNGASFLTYPQVIALLMDRKRRLAQLQNLHDGVREHSTLFDVDREFTLEEIAVVTRAAPARMLGLSNKGHLGVGADADITIYQPDDDFEKMFSFPRTVIKSGEVVLDDGECLRTERGSHLTAESIRG